MVWTFANPVQALQLGDALTVQTNCPGRLTWWREGRQAQSAELAPVGGVMAGTRRYRFTLGPLEGGTLFFRFRCTQPDCDHQSLTCKEGLQTVGVI